MFGKVRPVRNCGPSDEPMCETSERCERLLSEGDLLPVSLDVGHRILEVFGFQSISKIVFRLRSTAHEINDVINGEALPSVEMLLGIQRITGASIDWLLTGKGDKFLPGEPVPADLAFPFSSMNATDEGRIPGPHPPGSGAEC
jgi:hypothetical protein